MHSSLSVSEEIQFGTGIEVRKYLTKLDFRNNRPYNVLNVSGNMFLSRGREEILRILTGQSTSSFNTAWAQIIVGDGSTDNNQDLLDLVGPNKIYAPMEVGYPTKVTLAKLSFKSTFDQSMANFDWREIGLKNFQSGILLNRKVYNYGVKTALEIWSVTLSLSVAING